MSGHCVALLVTFTGQIVMRTSVWSLCPITTVYYWAIVTTASVHSSSRITCDVYRAIVMSSSVWSLHRITSDLSLSSSFVDYCPIIVLDYY